MNRRLKETDMRKSWIAAACLFGALAGCGGGGSDSTAAPTASVPPSASATIEGFVDYLQTLIASAADMVEPVDVSAVVPPTDETSEPVALH